MSGSMIKLLVVEGDVEVRQCLQSSLSRLGYGVELASDTAEALECLRLAAGFAAVLLDVGAASRNGLETLREARQLYPQLPVIVMSGAPSPANIVAAMKGGATDFLEKPVSHEQLRAAITRALDVKTVECLGPHRGVVP